MLSKQASFTIEVYLLEQKESFSATSVISVNTYNQILHTGKLGI